MHEIQVFTNPQFGQIRTIEINGEPWFVGKDIAERLGYSNTRKALCDHVDVDDKGVTKCDTLGGTQDITIINESGLYSLVLSSKLPAVMGVLPRCGCSACWM
jgi:prophage antirepressor-like protein